MVDLETFLTALFVFVDDFAKSTSPYTPQPEMETLSRRGNHPSPLCAMGPLPQRAGLLPLRQRPSPPTFPQPPHTLMGLFTRLAAKMALHNFCIWLNRQLERPALAFADLLGWA